MPFKRFKIALCDLGGGIKIDAIFDDVANFLFFYYLEIEEGVIH